MLPRSLDNKHSSVFTRQSERSLRCNDTKQVRDVSASQCAAAHLLRLSLFLTESYTSLCHLATRSAVTCIDTKHDYEILPFSSSNSEAFSPARSTPITFLRAEILPCRCTRNRENIVLLLACLYAKCTATPTWHSGGEVMSHVVSNLRVCKSQ